MKVIDALEKLKKVLSTERYEHTVRVLDVARELARSYKADIEVVELAAIFHDYAKEMTGADLKKNIKSFEIDESLLRYHKELWHGPVAAHLVKEEFKITNESVFNAIYYHTTGRADMDLVELVLFVADYIEPARNFPGVDDVRQLAKKDLHEAALLTLKNTIPYLISKNATIIPHTFYAYNDLLLTVTGGNK